MAEQRKNYRPAGQELEVADPASIRNVVLIGPGGSGKTTLVETLLHQAGAITRAGTISDGNTVCDSEPAERRHERTLSLAVAPVVHEGVKINLIDVPGYADFVGDLRAGLRAADAALFVVAANEHIDAATRSLWQECAEVGMPRAVVITKLDQAQADYPGVLAAAQAAFGESIVPLYVPVREGDDVTALAGLLSPDEHTDDELRGTLLEAVIEESEDETLMDRYVGGERVDEALLMADLEKAVAKAAFHPVVPVCSVTGVGCAELFSLMVRGFPSPVERGVPEAFAPTGASAPAMTCDPDGPLLAEVVRTTSDPYVGRLSVVRVLSGTLRGDATVHVSGHFTSFFGEGSGHADHDEDERIGALAFPLGAASVPTEQAIAGDICMVARLSRAETGDTLSGLDQPLVLRPWTMPQPQLPVAVVARTKRDEDKLGTALSRLSAEDPSLRVEFNDETHQLVLWCMGEAHSGVVIERLKERYDVDVDEVPVEVSLRETFKRPSKGHGRHVKQSGGHGQFAVCDLEVEPLPEGAGFEFASKVVGGSVPKHFIPSVEAGVRAQMERGLSHGYPVVDIRVTVTDGKAHAVDSSDMAFQLAGGLGLREAAGASTIILLEPFDSVEVTVPNEQLGHVLSDISARRGRVSATENAGDTETVIRAELPQLELVRYAVDLRAATHGAGTFTRAFAHYEPMPEELVSQVARRDRH